MATAPILVVWFVLIAVSLGGIAVSVLAIMRGVARGVAYVSLVLKGLVAVAFAAYFVALRAGAFSGWGDLTTFASLLVLSVGALMVTLVFDVVTAVLVVRHGSGARS